MTLQFRPQTPPGSVPLPLYNPERDIAYLIPALLPKVAELFASETWSPLKATLTQLGVEQCDLIEAAAAFSRGVTLAVTDISVQTADDAMRLGGFYACNPHAQSLLLVPLTEMLIAAFFRGIRQTTRKGENPETQTDIAEFVVATREYLQSRGYTSVAPLPASFDESVEKQDLQWQNELLRKEKAETEELLRLTQEELLRLQESGRDGN